MKLELPDILQLKDSTLTILYSKNAELNKTNNAIVIQGSRPGFLSLSNAIFFCLNDLQNTLEVSGLPFATSNIRLTIETDEALKDVEYGTIEKFTETQFRWRMSESEVCRVASEIHSLGYANMELHFDRGKDPTEISLYCVVS